MDIPNVGQNVIKTAGHEFTSDEIVYASYQDVTIAQLREQFEKGAHNPESGSPSDDDLTLDALIGGIHNDESKKPSGEATQSTGTE